MKQIFFGILLCVALCIVCTPLAAESLWLREPAISPDGKTIAFNYRGDLWLVSVEGGQARLLTLHESYDTNPIWSRDGKQIAFASDRYGNFDIWLISAEGGQATRLTYHSASDIPTSFSPGDRGVVFRSSRLDDAASVQFPTGAQPELYEVALDGGIPSQIVTTPAIYAVHDRSGRQIAYSDRKGYENPWRKHDTSSFARDIWTLDTRSGKHNRLTEFGYDDRQPVWSADEKSLYYLSERSGSFNVWKLDLAEPSKPVQVTQHKTHPVRFLSISDSGDLAYTYDGAIWVRPSDASRSSRIQVDAERDLRTNASQSLDVSRQISEFDVSADGKQIAFIARGEVFVTSTEHDAARRITNTPEQERSVSFHPDGRSLLYAGERDGSWNLYRADMTDENELTFFNATAITEKVVLEIDEETFQPSFSPDGKEVAYLKERTQLEVVNLESGKRRVILPGERNYSYIDGDQNYSWSPDGQHFLVDYLSPTRWSNEVGLVAADGSGEVVNLTSSGYEDTGGNWVLEGNAMFWGTDRWGGRQHAGWSSEWDIRMTFFNEAAWDRWRLSELELEQFEELEKRAKKEKEKEEAKGKKEEESEGDEKDKDEEADEIKLPDPVEIDLDGLKDRTIRLTIHSSRLNSAVMTPDGERLLYLARFEKGYDLWSYEPRKQEVKLLAKLNAQRASNLRLDKEGKKAFLLVNGGLRKITIAEGAVKPVSLSARMDLDREAEREHLYEHVWRQTLKKFHDVEMHGVDWARYKKEYARFLPHISNSRDFAELLSELLGELNASHTGGRYFPRSSNGDATASLGFFPDPEWKKAGVRIGEVMPRSPLLGAKNEISAGTVIVAIDGESIASGQNWYPLLNRKAGTNVRLSLQDPDGEEREEVVKPVASDSRLRYDRWERSRRETVERLSKGRIGYAHIRGMSDGGLRDIFEDIFGESVDKEAIILDTRFNGGGNLDEAIPILLSGQTYMRAKPRGQYVGSVPADRWTKPSIIIQNEGNYSDAHCVPNAYRSLGLGKTVGMQVPGTCTSVWWETLQDRELVFGIPEVTWLDNDGIPMENNHFDADYEIDNDPQIEAEGRDQQLEKAVEVLLQQLGKP